MNTPDLPPANENPWYILMTLYGEQERDGYDLLLHAKNRAVWNAWSCQNLSEEERAKLEADGVELPAVGAWEAMADDVTARHRRVFADRNGEDAAYSGVPDVAHKVDLSDIQFSNRLVLEDCIFSSVADFRSATFSSDAHFGSATFEARAYFTSATFSSAAYFRSATFSSAADFYSATFISVADFGSAMFSSAADFYSATFISDAYFFSATFSSVAHFRSATFEARAYFIGTKFGYAKDGDDPKPSLLDLTDAQFEKPASFRDAKFLNRYPDFTGAIVHEKSLFPWEDANWVGPFDQDAKTGRDSCAFLRHHLSKQGLPEAEMFFFKREMGFAERIGGVRDRLPYRFYGGVSDFGHSIALPFWYLVGLFVAPLGMYFAAFGGDSFYAAANSAGLSISSIFKFFGFQRLYFGSDFMSGVHWSVRIATAVQTVFGYGLLFFLGLGLRTRFRLR